MCVCPLPKEPIVWPSKRPPGTRKSKQLEMLLAANAPHLERRPHLQVEYRGNIFGPFI